MTPCRRYRHSGKIIGSFSRRHDNIVIQQYGDTFYAKKMKKPPQYDAFITYDASMNNFMNSLEEIIYLNGFKDFTCVDLDLEKSLDFILKTNVGLYLLPLFSEVFPGHVATSHPIQFDVEKLKKPERTVELEFLFPKAFVGQEIFLGEKLRVTTKRSSDVDFDVELIGGDKARRIIEIKNKILFARRDYAETKILLDSLSNDLDRKVDELVENSKIIEFAILNVEEKKIKLNEEYLIEKQKIEDKWGRVYQEYRQRRVDKLAKLEEEIKKETDPDRLEKLGRRRVELQSQFERGHSQNRHEEQLELLDEDMKQKMAEYDAMIDEESRGVVESNESLNREIEEIQTEKSRVEEKIFDLSNTINNLEKEKSELTVFLELEREKFIAREEKET